MLSLHGPSSSKKEAAVRIKEIRDAFVKDLEYRTIKLPKDWTSDATPASWAHVTFRSDVRQRIDEFALMYGVDATLDTVKGYLVVIGLTPCIDRFQNEGCRQISVGSFAKLSWQPGVWFSQSDVVTNREWTLGLTKYLNVGVGEHGHCGVCGTEINKKNYSDKIVLSECGHLYCVECLINQIGHEVGTGGCTITCKVPLDHTGYNLCGASISVNDISKGLASEDKGEELWRRLMEAEMDRLKKRSPGVVNFAKCPMPNCQIIHRYYRNPVTEEVCDIGTFATPGWSSSSSSKCTAG